MTLILIEIKPIGDMTARWVRFPPGKPMPDIPGRAEEQGVLLWHQPEAR